MGPEDFEVLQVLGTGGGSCSMLSLERRADPLPRGGVERLPWRRGESALTVHPFQPMVKCSWSAR